MRTVVAPLPDGVKGFVTEDAEGYCTVILNSRNSREQNIATAIHEMRHIQNGDLHSEDAVDDIEHALHMRGGA